MASIAVKDIPQLYQKALRLQAAGQIVEAHGIYNQIVAARPQTAEAHYQIGKIARQAKDYELATKALSNARRLKPREPKVLQELAATLADAGQSDEAIALYQQLLKLSPRDANAAFQLGLIHQREGDFDQAEAAFRKALKIQPGEGTVYRAWVQGRKIRKGEPLIREMLEARSKGPNRGASLSRAHLHFALAKAMEDTGETGKVFPFLNEANALFAKSYPFDRKAFDRDIEHSLKALDTLEYSGPRPALDNTAFAPILVTGLPRSGTTLVEQILASHSMVTGGGEMAVLPRIVTRLLHGRDGKDWQPASLVTPEQYAAFPAAIEKEMRKRVAFDLAVTDKSITNYRFIGLLKKLIPNIRIILVRRDPRDQLLSMYKNVFAEGTHVHSYDMEALAHYYKGFTRVIDFWRERCPEDFTEVVYEELVNDPEPQARRIVEAAGLEWEEACLNFHETRREVRTLSIHQVRQPMYTSSARAWEKYAEDLKPLTDALEANGSLAWR